MYECYGPKKKAPKNVSYLLPLRHVASRPTNTNTSYPNASPPSRHCACPNPKQAQGPLKNLNIPSHHKIHNIYLHTNVFHSNLDIIYKILHPSSQTRNYFIDPTTHFGGDPINIYNLVFFY
jgi:hypothetical protein